jgi:indole-3-glycerol phosphate synthase
LTDFLDILAIESIERVSKGYYDVQDRVEREPVSLLEAITTCKRIPVVAEIKKRSPSLGYLRDEIDPVQVSIAFKNGGAVGISVITEPNRFGGSLQLLRGVRETVHLPLLMKDIVVREVQVEAASRLGADVVLLIAALFDRCYRELSVQNMINFAHSKNLEVILETHNEKEFSYALDTDADIIGINNRDLRDLSVNLETAYKILKECKPDEKIVIVESGIQDRGDLNKLLEVGADAFLIGSSIMKARDIEEKLREFTMTNENC